MSTKVIYHQHSSASAGTGLLSRILAVITGNLLRHRVHAALSNLDDRMLRDIGLTRADVERLEHH